MDGSGKGLGCTETTVVALPPCASSPFPFFHYLLSSAFPTALRQTAGGTLLCSVAQHTSAAAFFLCFVLCFSVSPSGRLSVPSSRSWRDRTRFGRTLAHSFHDQHRAQRRRWGSFHTMRCSANDQWHGGGVSLIALGARGVLFRPPFPLARVAPPRPARHCAAFLFFPFRLSWLLRALAGVVGRANKVGFAAAVAVAAAIAAPTALALAEIIHEERGARRTGGPRGN